MARSSWFVPGEQQAALDPGTVPKRNPGQHLELRVSLNWEYVQAPEPCACMKNGGKLQARLVPRKLNSLARCTAETEAERPLSDRPSESLRLHRQTSK